MNTTVIRTSVGDTPTAQSRFRAPRWMREPLLHFLVLGAALFGIDHLIASRADDPRTIVIDAEVDGQAIEVFKQARGHEPNSEELYALRRVWLDNEVLYREGVALGLDKGDKAIRERVIFKALSVVDASVRLPPYAESTLREWFEQHRAKYDTPARYDFEEAVIAGDRSEARARAFASTLNVGGPGDIEADLRVFTGRPHENLVQSYGAEFTAALEAAPAGEWRAIGSREGGRESVRVVRMKSFTPSTAASFDELSGIVLQDWTDAVMAEQRSAAVRALARKYTVKVTDPAR